jgi:hypothetical protein
MSNDTQHWDKIVFEIKSSSLARKVNLTANTELDIKVRDDPTKVADIKQKVLNFLHVPTAPASNETIASRNAIQILNVNYAIICSSSSSSPIASTNIGPPSAATIRKTQVPLSANATNVPSTLAAIPKTPK